MKARLITGLIRGSEVLDPGQIVEGKEAADFITAGLAVPIKEEPVKPETAALKQRGKTKD